MTKPLDEQYLVWLYKRVGYSEFSRSSETYWELLKQMYKKEFQWVLSDDDNRAADGLSLRDDFMIETDNEDPEWSGLGCSLLEVVVALSKRAAFSDDLLRGESYWFWTMMDNAGLSTFDDDRYWTLRPGPYVDALLENLMNRRYGYDGTKGFFPLKHPDQDQREVEMWYQLQSYLIENS